MAEYLYLEGACGISGDMAVAALLDLGANRGKLDAVLQSLGSKEFDYHISRKSSYGISGCDFAVRLHDGGHAADGQCRECRKREHRRLSDVYEIIDRADMTQNARALAKKIFLIVAQAESKAHGCPVEKVHFHEVGAVDSIVDIVSAAVLLDDLNINKVIVNGLSEGHGVVACRHGCLPVPVPAVLNIAEKYGILLRPSDNDGEMVTPTGIAIAAAVKTSEKLPAVYKVLKTGIGLGKRDFGRADFLRALLIEDCPPAAQMYVIETNIDDSTAEELGLAMEKLLAVGAADVHFEPCFMKKNRPAYILRVITSAALLPQAEDIIFRNTSTIGLRKYPVQRTCMERRIIKVKLDSGEVDVKKCRLGDIVRYHPEYESVKALAEKIGQPFRKVFEAARKAAEETDGV